MGIDPNSATERHFRVGKLSPSRLKANTKIIIGDSVIRGRIEWPF